MLLRIHFLFNFWFKWGWFGDHATTGSIFLDQLIATHPSLLLLTWLRTRRIDYVSFLLVGLLWPPIILILLVLGHFCLKCWLIFFLCRRRHQLRFAFLCHCCSDVWFNSRFWSFIMPGNILVISIIVVINWDLGLLRRSFIDLLSWIGGELRGRGWLFFRIWSFWLLWCCLALLEHIFRRSVEVGRL